MEARLLLVVSEIIVQQNNVLTIQLLVKFLMSNKIALLDHECQRTTISLLLSHLFLMSFG